MVLSRSWSYHLSSSSKHPCEGVGKRGTDTEESSAFGAGAAAAAWSCDGGGWRRMEQTARHPGSAFSPAAASLPRLLSSRCLCLLPVKRGYQDSANSEASRRVQNTVLVPLEGTDCLSMVGDLLLLHGKALPLPGQAWSCHGKT